MMDRDIGADVAHSARVYNYWLGGKDNFAADRELAEQIKLTVPTVPKMVRANRDFILRATRYLTADAGIRQFLDIGTGIPAPPNLHEAAQAIAPDSRVVYVDNDPLVLVHARALLTSGPQGLCTYLDADLRNPESILDSIAVTGTLDLTRPVAVTFGSILMLLGDHDDPWAVVRHLMNAMPTGSYLVISHPTGDMDPTAMRQVAEVSQKAGMTFVPRSKKDVARFFDGYKLIDPGLVPVLDWRPDDTPPADLRAAYYWVAVARS